MNEKTNAKHKNELLKEALLKRLPRPARLTTAASGLALMRYDEESHLECCFYKPMIALIVQGQKRALIGNKEYCYGDGQCMVVCMDMPGVYHITKAEAECPFLSVSIALDKYIITQLLAQASQLAQKKERPLGAVLVSEATEEIVDAFLRLVKTLDNPVQSAVLAPIIVREIHFHLLAGPLGDCLCMANTIGTQANQIALSVNWLREHYKERLHVEDLAKLVNMAPSTFHRHFQQVTTLSPVQFQKRLRLYEAERLMVLEGKNAGSAALAVGYESVSQFNREYKRLFGSTPLQNISKKRING